MNYQFVDNLDKVIAKDTENDLSILAKEGVLNSEGHVVQNKRDCRLNCVNIRCQVK